MLRAFLRSVGLMSSRSMGDRGASRSAIGVASVASHGRADGSIHVAPSRHRRIYSTPPNGLGLGAGAESIRTIGRRGRRSVKAARSIHRRRSAVGATPPRPVRTGTHRSRPSRPTRPRARRSSRRGGTSRPRPPPAPPQAVDAVGQRVEEREVLHRLGEAFERVQRAREEEQRKDGKLPRPKGRGLHHGLPL